MAITDRQSNMDNLKQQRGTRIEQRIDRRPIQHVRL
jgi:hypothetical protein